MKLFEPLEHQDTGRQVQDSRSLEIAERPRQLQLRLAALRDWLWYGISARWRHLGLDSKGKDAVDEFVESSTTML